MCDVTGGRAFGRETFLKLAAIFVVVLAASYVFSLDYGSDSSDAATSGTTGDCTWVLDGTVLTISGSGKMGNYDIYSSYGPWGKGVTSVVFQGSVTSIGDYAFHSCTSLTSVDIPSSVTYIGFRAFHSCTSLTSVDIPSSVTSIGNDAFCGCTSLSSVSIPSSVTFMGEGAFSGCTSLTSVDIPSSLTSIGTSVFSGTSLSSVSIPSSVTTIGNFAFYRCTSLTSVDIPSSVNTIGKYAFQSCTSLFTIDIPSSVTTIRYMAFSDCISLRTVLIEKTASSVRVEENAFPDGAEVVYVQSKGTCGDALEWTLYTDGRLSVKGSGEMYDYDETGPWGTGVTSVEIADGVTSIGAHAFHSCTSLASVTIPSSVTYIGDWAFHSCTSLTSVSIPSSVTSIGWNAFRGCTSLSSIDVSADNGNYCSVDGVLFNKEKTMLIQCPAGNARAAYDIPPSVTYIGSWAFIQCSSLFSVTIPSSVTAIGEYAFYGCTSLASLTIADGSKLDSVGSGAFLNTSVKNLTIPIDVDASLLADHLNSLVTVNLTKGVNGEGCNYDWNSTNVTGSDGKVYVCFLSTPWGRSVETLRGINIGDGVRSIGQYGVYGVHGVESITLPASLEKTGDGLAWLWDLKSIEVEEGNQYLKVDEGTGMLLSKDGKTLYLMPPKSDLTDIRIPNGVETVGHDAFALCFKAEDVHVPSTVKTIQWWAFNTHGFDHSWKNVYIEDLESWMGIWFWNEASNPLYLGLDLWYETGEKVTSLSIPSSVDSVKEYAFRGCASLSSVIIPNSVTSIGDYAFYGCTSLSTVLIVNTESGVTIGSSAFPDGVTPVYVQGAGTCGDGLEWILHADGRLTIKGAGAMYDYSETGPWGTGVTSVEIEDGVTSIGHYAFRGCPSLSSVSIPSSVTSIRVLAFFECTSLAYVYIPSSVTFIEANAFNGCTSLGGIEVSESNTSYSSEDGVLFNKDKTVLVKHPAGMTDVSYVVPDTVTSIGYDAFHHCTSLSSVSIRSPVTSIGLGAFSGCSSLVSVEIPDTVTSLGDWAFHYCTSLPSFTFPSNLGSIGKYTFHGCTSLTSVTIPSSVTSIGIYAFYECTSLRTVLVESTASDVTVGENAFPDGAEVVYVQSKGTCGDGLEWTLYTDGRLSVNGTGAMYDYLETGPWGTGVKSVEIADGVTSIGAHAFHSCTSLASVTIPSSVTYIGDWAFHSCTSLTSVSIPSSVTSIGWNAFRGCASLSSIDVSADNGNYCSVDGVLFNKEKTMLIQCPAGNARATYDIPSSVTYIGSWAFIQCTSLSSVTIPSSVTSIGEYAFYGCTSLTSLTIADGSKLESVGSNVFLNTSVKNLTIPIDVDASILADHLNSLEKVVFTAGETGIGCDYGRNEYNMPDNPWARSGETCKVIVFSEGVKSIGAHGLYNCLGIAELNLPSTVESVSDLWNPNLKIIAVADGNTSFKTIDGMLYTIDGKTLMHAPPAGVSGVVVVPDGTEIIGGDAFSSAENLTGVKFPESLKEIQLWAFHDCVNLDGVQLNASLSTIGQGAFGGCTSLSSFTFSSSLSYVGKYAFAWCYSIETLKFEGFPANVGADAFSLGDQDHPASCHVYFGSGASAPYGPFPDLSAYSDGYTTFTIVLPAPYDSPMTYTYDGSDVESHLMSASLWSYESSYLKSSDCGTFPVDLVLVDGYRWEGTLESRYGISVIVSPATFTVADIPDLTYGATEKTPDLTVTIAGGSIVLVKGTDYTVAFTDNVDAGTAKATVTGIGNYTGNVDKTFTITKAPMTVTATGVSLTYDGESHSLIDATAIGLEGIIYAVVPSWGSDNTLTHFGSKSVAPTGCTVADEGVDVTANYMISYVAGTLEITKRTVTLTSATASKTYDGIALTDHKVTVTGEGFVTGQGAIYTFTGSQTDAGTGMNTFTYVLNSGTKASNYNITKTEGTLEVTKAAMTVTATGVSTTYDGQGHSLTSASVTVGLEGHTYTVIPMWGEDNTLIHCGIKSVKAVEGTVVMDGGVDVTSNYEITFADGTLEITKRAVTLTSATDHKTYDGTPLVNRSVTQTGFVSGEGVTAYATGSLVHVSENSADNNPIAYTWNSNTSAADYSVTEILGTLSIERRTVSVAANDVTVCLWDSPPSYSATVENICDGDVLDCLRYSCPYARGSGVGSYAITVSGPSVYGDYVISSYVGGFLTVTNTFSTGDFMCVITSQNTVSVSKAPDVSDVTIPDEVLWGGHDYEITSVLIGAFGSETKHVALGKNVSSAGADVFGGLVRLQSIEVDAQNSTYSSPNGALLSARGDVLYLVPFASGSVFEIPAKVTTVSAGALVGNVRTLVACGTSDLLFSAGANATGHNVTLQYSADSRISALNGAATVTIPSGNAYFPVTLTVAHDSFGEAVGPVWTWAVLIFLLVCLGAVFFTAFARKTEQKDLWMPVLAGTAADLAVTLYLMKCSLEASLDGLLGWLYVVGLVSVVLEIVSLLSLVEYGRSGRYGTLGKILLFIGEGIGVFSGIVLVERLFVDHEPVADGMAVPILLMAAAYIVVELLVAVKIYLVLGGFGRAPRHMAGAVVEQSCENVKRGMVFKVPAGMISIALGDGEVVGEEMKLTTTPNGTVTDEKPVPVIFRGDVEAKDSMLKGCRSITVLSFSEAPFTIPVAASVRDMPYRLSELTCGFQSNVEPENVAAILQRCRSDVEDDHGLHTRCVSNKALGEFITKRLGGSIQVPMGTPDDVEHVRWEVIQTLNENAVVLGMGLKVEDAVLEYAGADTRT